MDAFAVSDTQGKTTKAGWYAELVRLGLADPLVGEDDYKAKDQKQRRFRKYVSELKIAGLIGVNGDEIADLRKP
jgi:hypothetical protein